ncbi:MAG: TIGR02391 family protein [Patescibacteria group bacterium]
MVDCCKELFDQDNYFHAVLEATKLYHNMVQKKSGLKKDGQDLMMQAFGESGILKITNCSTDTEKNFEEGIKFLSAGLMRALRNPTAHEKKMDWDIDKEDCLNILGLISYLLKQLNKINK